MGTFSRKSRSESRMVWTRFSSLVTAILLFSTACLIGESLGSEFCSSGDRPNMMRVIEEGADISIGALLNVHEMGSKGFYGCSNITTNGLIVYAALQWIISIINQESGLINNKKVVESFIPGVKIGAHVFDSCSHKDLSRQHLAEMYPVLETGSEVTCSSDFSEIRAPGVIDVTGASFDPRVNELTQQNFIPILPLSSSAALPPDTVGKLVTEIIRDLNWTRVTVVHASDEHSVHVVKLLGQAAVSGKMCFSAVEALPPLDADDSGRGMTNAELRGFARVLNTVASHPDADLPVFVIGAGEPIRRFIHVMTKNINLISKYQWFFSSMPEPEVIKSFGPALNGLKLFTLAPYPGKFAQLEEYWQHMQAATFEPVFSDSTRMGSWFHEYVWLKQGCTGNKCPNKMLIESDTDALWRTWIAFPPVHAIFNFAFAIRNAWIDLCKGTRGLCLDLKKITRKQFIASYLEPLQFEHNPSLRSPPEMSGRKSENSRSGEIEGMKLAITRFSVDSLKSLNYHQLIAYDSSTNEGRIVDHDFVFKPSPCPKNGCEKCIKVRQSRIEEEGMYSDNKNPNSVHVDTGIVHVSQRDSDFIIPLILPIHKAGKSQLVCSQELNPEAIYDLEAALWAISNINADAKFVPGIQFGVAIIDTCSSPLKATERVSRYLTHETDHTLGSVALDRAVGFIASTTPEEAKVTSDLISALNISVLLAKDVTATGAKLGIDRGIYQIALPFEQFVSATIEQLKYFGWRFVSVVNTKGDLESEALLGKFKELAGQSSICLRKITSLNKNDLMGSAQSALLDLKKGKESGANVVVLLTDTKSTRALVSTFKRFIDGGSMSRNDFLFIIVQESNLNVVAGLESEIMGSLLIREGQGSIKSFLDYFGTLKPETNTRNPWFKEFWGQGVNCQGHHCLVQQMNPISAVNTMQSVIALVSGFARLRNEVCGNESGLCLKLQTQPEVRNNISYYVQYTASMKADYKSSSDMFSFTKDGHGAKNVDILNFKREAEGSGPFRFDNVASFMNNNLKRLKNGVYTAYDNLGAQFPAEHIRSACFPTNACTRYCRAPSVEPAPTPSSTVLSLQVDSGTVRVLPVDADRATLVTPKFKSEEFVGDRPPLGVNFRRTWGVTTSIVSGLGVLLALVCGIYCLMVFPVAIGTTILGYTILLGLLILYLVNFLYVLPPTVSICWLRRIGMSVGYCTILSGMLVKVMNTWRLMAYRSARTEQLKLTSPFGLLFISGGLVVVQIVMTTIWLVVFPPKPGMYDSTWKCSPSAAGFILETESVVSLLYIMLLVVITAFFSALTWKCYDNNREPRWILVCCSTIAASWSLWAIFALKFPQSFESAHDMSVICANLTCASLIMISLYLRKLYLFAKLRRKDRDLKARLNPSFPGSFYGALHTAGNFNPILWEGSQSTIYGGSPTASTNSSVRAGKGTKGVKGVGRWAGTGATRPPFDEDQLDDGTSSCGSTTSSVQVQGHDLYPMEVYDGGSQFQPNSLTNANSSISVYVVDETNCAR